MKPELPTGISSAVIEGGRLIVLRLYLAGGTLASTQAWINLTAICELAPDCLHVEVVDILREPLRALSEGILVTPTLVRVSPLPMIKIVGDLSDRATVLNALGLADARLK